MKRLHTVSTYMLMVALPLFCQTACQTAFCQDTVNHNSNLANANVLAIFETHCIQCHNTDFKQGGFDLSTPASFFEGGEKLQPINKENPAESPLLKMIKHEAEPFMPFGMDKLSDEDIKVIEDWIKSGAVWESDAALSNKDPKHHWAYQPVQYPGLGNVWSDTWIRNQIDVYIRFQLSKVGLNNSQDASKETLIRRLSLDLTGLPPDPVEVDNFVNDDSPHAYENFVNRLLASPHFGERWATHWLDLARYADSNGFEKDSQREMWAYRDWVIDAINSGMPFDQFTIEQIAGDLLPGSTLQQKVATGYHRNTMLNLEGGVNQEEYRVAAVIDRTNTTATVWLATTMACAQCHDHKFDPFIQEDYFSFFAFFNSTQKEIKQVESFEAQSDGPFLAVPNAEQQKVNSEITPQIEQLKAKMQLQTPSLINAQKEWEQNVKQNAIDWQVVTPVTVTAEEGSQFDIQEDGSVLAVDENPITDTYHIELNADGKKITGIRLELLMDGSLPDGGPGRRQQGRFTLTEVSLNAILEDASHREIQLINPSADWNNNSIRKTIDDDENSGWGNGRENQHNFEAVYQTPNLDLISSNLKMILTLKMKSGAGETIGKFRVAVTADEQPEANQIPDDVWNTIHKNETERNHDETAALSGYFRSVTPLFAEERKKIEQLQSQLPKNLPSLMVMQELEQPRDTRIFKGGSYLQPGESVNPKIPAIFRAEQNQQWKTRLDLARWLVDEQNPLTARVFVNRIWEQLFGYGIVETTEDFGTRSPEPVNQKLLDFLAYRFMEDHWSLKSLLYLIVTSSAYRQDSAITPEKLEADPKNRYLSRGASYRLRGEFIRDNGLKISGLLNAKIGGPSVFPYQPDGIWNMPYSSDQWVESKNGDQFRRGLYTHWQRTATYPMYVNFDAPSRETVCTHRIRTNTPLQALNLLNDPAFFVMAQGLAKRMIEEMDGSVEDRLTYGFRVCTSRYPSETELQKLIAYYEKQLAYYEDHQNEALSVIKEKAQAEGVSTPQHAAYVMASNVLLNLHETISKR